MHMMQQTYRVLLTSEISHNKNRHVSHIICATVNIVVRSPAAITYLHNTSKKYIGNLLDC